MRHLHQLEYWSIQGTAEIKKYFSSSIGCENTLSTYINSSWWGESGGILRSKNIEYPVCEFMLKSYFEWYGANRLGQFTELALYAYIYIYTYILLTVFLRPYIILPFFLRPSAQNQWDSLLLVERSGVYIRVPYSADTPVPSFYPFRELTTTICYACAPIPRTTIDRIYISGYKESKNQMIYPNFFNLAKTDSISPISAKLAQMRNLC